MKLRNKKTGKIIEYSISLNQWSEDDHEWYLFGNYDSIGELKEDWEECKLNEPYIKDDKILKLVREWAKAFGVTKVYVCAIGDGKEYIELYAQDDGVTDGRIRISIPTQDGVWIGKEYAVDELIGEEE